MPKESLRDKLDGNELDLSLGNLESVPVKELASLPKATHLDLSCNLITTIPESFCSLRHIVRVDFSKNSISELPPNFGDLVNLQHLDLLGNKLEILPVSFWQLRKLKWLDLKDNPLDEGLKKAAGDCLDDVQCRRCAQQVLAFMKAINSDLERRKQKKLQEERDQESQRKVEEEMQRQRKKAEKLKEKEKRRKEYEAKKKQTESGKEEVEDEDESVTETVSVPEVHKKKGGRGWSCCFAFINIVLFVVAASVGLYIYCDMKKIIPQCQEVVTMGDNLMRHTRAAVHHYLNLITGKKK
ncbi:leucine-rich repeat-containing protein 59-like [Liolophura sinensis]|uniref:leucine-rich repeat-containing protein 59-like n=1 Tax=Liolophura sinensis TaxID=3198878 RepID=UPI00315882E7